jgi:predicted nuclease of predicted toxin-antitoxin system
VRVLCDENVPAAVEHALRAAGHDVAAVRSRSPGASDRIVLQQAIDESRVLITYDRDFGTLLFRNRVRPAPLVLFVRTSASPSADGQRVLVALRHVEPGHIVVVDGESLRKRVLDQ